MLRLPSSSSPPCHTHCEARHRGIGPASRCLPPAGREDVPERGPPCCTAACCHLTPPNHPGFSRLPAEAAHHTHHSHPAGPLPSTPASPRHPHHKPPPPLVVAGTPTLPSLPLPPTPAFPPPYKPPLRTSLGAGQDTAELQHRHSAETLAPAGSQFRYAGSAAGFSTEVAVHLARAQPAQQRRGSAGSCCSGSGSTQPRQSCLPSGQCGSSSTAATRPAHSSPAPGSAIPGITLPSPGQPGNQHCVPAPASAVQR